MSETNAQPLSPQEDFDRRYITSTEIQRELGVERSTILYARRRGMLPEPIIVQGVRAFIWERDKIRPYLNAWRLSLRSRRGELV